MPQVRVHGVPPYDGLYDLDLDHQDLTTREWGWIKRHAGYLPQAVDESALGDPELITAFAVIALCRAGKVQPADAPRMFDQLADVPFGDQITVEATPAEAGEGDAGPPPSSSSGNGAASGPASTTNSETSPPPPRVSGTPASDSSAFAPVRSGS